MSATATTAEARAAGLTALRGRMPWATVISLAVFLLAWEVIGRLTGWRALPPVSDVYSAWMSFYHEGVLLTVLRQSAQTFAIGVVLAVGAAILVSLLMSVSTTADHVLAPYIDAGMSVPITATIPILMMVFGLGAATRVAVVFLYSFFIVVVSLQAGLRKVDPGHLQMAAAFGASRGEVLRKIVVPSAFPMAVTGIRLGISRGMRGMVNAEVIISAAGIGWLLMRSARQFDIAGVYAVTATIVVAAILIMGLFSVLERTVFRSGS